MSADRAARRIVNACLRGDSEIVLSVPAKAAVKFHDMFPGITADLMGIVNQLLPSADPSDKRAKTGKESFSDLSPSWITALNERAAASNNQVP